MSQQAQNDHYPDRRALAMDYADAVAAEIADLHAAGADIVQVDEPYLQSFLDDARDNAVEAINRSLAGAPCPVVLHTCFGYAHFVKSKTTGYPFLVPLADTTADYLAIEAAQPNLDLNVLSELGDKGVVLGVIDLNAPPETPEVVAERIRKALPFVPPERLVLAPDCGMKYIPRDVANAKLRALVAGTAIVRRELSGGS
jgi:5-methyltetrahydropteroyltriglutamate--homocysteine methyltransferase